ncbi:dethiobiotin synthase [bacterium]|nr:dethiobiotin synthase [bacterium]
MQNNYEDVIIEGLGGVLSPLTTTMTFLDLFEQLKLETIVVVKNQVGAINHALLTIEALASRQIPIKGFVCNTIDSTLDPAVKKDNPVIIQQLSGVSLIASLGSEQQVEWLF